MMAEVSTRNTPLPAAPCGAATSAAKRERCTGRLSRVRERPARLRRVRACSAKRAARGRALLSDHRLAVRKIGRVDDVQLHALALRLYLAERGDLAHLGAVRGELERPLQGGEFARQPEH